MITGVAYEPTLFVLEHLRPPDRREIEAARGFNFNRYELALQVDRQGGYIAWEKPGGAPIAVWGAHRVSPTTLGVFAFSTDKWRKAVKLVTRHVRTTMIPALLKAGFHRAECRALATRADTRRWLTSLGFKAEGVLSHYGVNREDFVLYAWTDDGAHHPQEHS